MGPLELGDLIGLDVCLAIMEVLYREFGDSKYRPHPLFCGRISLLAAGRRPESGFTDYSNNDLLYRDTMLGNISPAFLLFPHFLQAAILNLLYVILIISIFC